MGMTCAQSHTQCLTSGGAGNRVWLVLLFSGGLAICRAIGVQPLHVTAMLASVRRDRLRDQCQDSCIMACCNGADAASGRELITFA